MARGLRFLTKRRLTPSETAEIFARFRVMDDRTCAIILGAMLDHSLERMLLLHMVPLSKDESDRLLYGTGPLGSCSSKIKIAHALGLIGPKSTHDLEILNDVRNAFGHAAHGISFRNRSIKSRLAGLHTNAIIDALLNAFRSEPIRRYKNTRGRFLLAAASYVKEIDETRRSKRPKRLVGAVHALDG
jgi:Mannitol repressor